MQACTHTHRLMDKATHFLEHHKRQYNLRVRTDTHSLQICHTEPAKPNGTDVMTRPRVTVDSAKGIGLVPLWGSWGQSTPKFGKFSLSYLWLFYSCFLVDFKESKREDAELNTIYNLQMVPESEVIRPKWCHQTKVMSPGRTCHQSNSGISSCN